MIPPAAEALSAPNELVPNAPAALWVIDPAVIAALVTLSAFVMVNEDRAREPPTAPLIERLAAAPGLKIKARALPELLTVPVIEIELPVLAIVEAPVSRTLPIQLMIPFVLTLLATEIVPDVTVKAPKAFDVPIKLLKVSVPLPHANVKAGLETTPSPFNVPLNTML